MVWPAPENRRSELVGGRWSGFEILTKDPFPPPRFRGSAHNVRWERQAIRVSEAGGEGLRGRRHVHEIAEPRAATGGIWCI
jgi:hypothetical protein